MNIPVEAKNWKRMFMENSCENPSLTLMSVTDFLKSFLIKAFLI